MPKFAVPPISFTEYHLENGLQVILSPRDRIPLVHVSLHYRVGSSYESPGMSGLAHLFEHMMFQGSANVGKNQHGLHIDQIGGQWNASTSKDRTNYFDTVPSHCLDLALWLEADRMRSLCVTEENFENQRMTVIEEKKQSYDNQPYGAAQLRFDELAYSNWAYAHSIIGSEEDLKRATLNDAQAFHHTYYGPGNAILVVAGDFGETQARELIGRHFGPIEDATSARRPDLAEPLRDRETYEEIDDPLAALPAVAIGYQMPALGTPEYYTLSMLALVLADGDSSRFYRRFVYDNNWITGLFAGPNQYKGPGIFRIWFQVREDVTPETVSGAVDEELHRIASDRVSDEEMEKARNQIEHRFVTRLSRVSRIGELLAQSASVFESPDTANQQLDHLLSVSAEQIRDTAAAVFQPKKRIRILVKPGGHS